MAEYKDKTNRKVAQIRMLALMQRVENRLGIPVSFDKSLDTSNLGGVTRSNGFVPVNIGIRNYGAYVPKSEKGFFKRRVTGEMPTDIYLNQVWALYHEEGHVDQFRLVCNGSNGELDRQIACERIASMYNPVYYSAFNSSGYANMYGMVSEIDAQRRAVKPFHQHCVELYGNEKLADQLTVQKAASVNYGFTFGNPNMFTRDDVLKHYDDIIEQSRSINWRRYPNQDDLPDYEKVFATNPDCVDEWFDKNMSPDFDRAMFPRYFATSKDVDKFVIAASNEIMQQHSNETATIKGYVEGISTLHSELFQWDTSIYKNMFETEIPTQQFNTNEYVSGELNLKLRKAIGDERYERDFPTAAAEEKKHPFKSYSNEAVAKRKEAARLASQMQARADAMQELADSKGLNEGALRPVTKDVTITR